MTVVRQYIVEIEKRNVSAVAIAESSRTNSVKRILNNLICGVKS